MLSVDCSHASRVFFRNKCCTKHRFARCQFCLIMDLEQWCESLLAAPTASAHSESDTPRANPEAVLPVQNLTSGEEEFVSDAAPAEVIDIDGRDEVIEVDGGDPGFTPESPQAVPTSMYTRPRVLSLWQCRYAAWRPHLIMPLAAFRDSLGPQTLSAIMASLASGAQPEHLFQTVTNIMSKVLFTCDPKQAAFQFARSQGFTSDHHFVAPGRAWCRTVCEPCLRTLLCTDQFQFGHVRGWH